MAEENFIYMHICSSFPRRSLSLNCTRLRLKHKSHQIPLLLIAMAILSTSYKKLIIFCVLFWSMKKLKRQWSWRTNQRFHYLNYHNCLMIIKLNMLTMRYNSSNLPIHLAISVHVHEAIYQCGLKKGGECG